MLQKHQHFNDLSSELRTKLEERVKSLGKKVRFKFNISNPNPDPQKYNGDVIWPGMYTLDPRTYRIFDTNENRQGVSKSKEIGLVDKLDKEGIPVSFHRVRVFEREKGIKTYDPTKYEDAQFIMYLLMHPKLEGGMFQDADKRPIISLIDEQKDAIARKEQRAAKLKALSVVKEMSDQKIIEFADAMQWDSTVDPSILIDQIETLAESDPKMFNDLIDSKSIEYQATIKRALDKKVISFDGLDTFTWANNQQTITVLSAVGDKSPIEKFAEWVQTGGQKCDAIYSKIKGLVK